MDTQTKNLILAKFIFFTNALSIVGWTRFQNNYFLDQGLHSYDIGSLKSLGLILKLFGEPFWSFIADMTNSKAVFSLCMIIQIISLEMLRTIRPLTYSTILAVKFLRTVTATNNSMVTTASFKLTDGTNEGYGQQRMFAAIAWGIGASCVGILIDIYGMDALFYFTYFFVLSNFLLVLYGFPSDKNNKSEYNILKTSTRESSSSTNIDQYYTSNKTLYTPNSSSSSSSSPSSTTYALINSLTNLSQFCRKENIHIISNKLHIMITEIKQFFSNPPCKLILLNAFSYGIVMTVVDTYVYLSIEQDYKGSRSFSGLCTMVSVLASTPLFWYSTSLMKAYGHFNLIYIAQCTCFIRLFLSSFLSVHTPHAIYIILVLQILHGFNFALYWSTVVDAIHKLSPEHLISSCLSTLNVMYFTLGGIVGNYLWGIVYEYTNNIQYVYFYASIMMLIVIFLWKSTERIFKNYAHLLQSVDNYTSVNKKSNEEHDEEMATLLDNNHKQ